MLINEIVSTILQLIVFAFIPFLVFFIQHRSTKGFLNYIGLKASNSKANLYGLLVSLVIAVPFILLTLIDSNFRAIMTSPSSISGQFNRMGPSFEAVILILLVAIFKTALAEEIFFRSFLGKRLVALTNFQLGNILQATLFGIVHLLLFLAVSRNFLFLFTAFFVPALAGYFMFTINEKFGEGSILPGWIAHATANILTYTIIGFLL